MSHPIRDPTVQAAVEAKAVLIEKGGAAGKLMVAFDYKDGRWKIGRASCRERV